MASPGKSLFKLELASLKPRTKPCLQCTFHLYGQNRSLTSSSSRRRNMTQAGFNSSNLMQNIPKQKSSKSRIKEFSRSELPSDFGLLPQTFINPSSRYLPSWFSSLYKERARIAWLRLRSSVTGFFTLFYFLKWQTRKNPLTGKAEKNPSLQLSKRHQIARELHKTLYDSVASGDMKTLQKIACSGLLEKMKIRVDHRKGANLPDEKWRVIQYNGITYPSWLRWPLLSILPKSSTHVVSDKVTPLPIGKDSHIRQCIVRLSTSQSLDKGDGRPPRMWQGTEYIVLQKLKIGEHDKDWMIWGTVEPSTLEEIDQLLNNNTTESDMGFMDRVRQSASSFMGA